MIAEVFLAAVLQQAAGCAPVDVKSLVHVTVMSYTTSMRRDETIGIEVNWNFSSSEPIDYVEFGLEDGSAPQSYSVRVDLGADGRYHYGHRWKAVINGTWPLYVKARDVTGREGTTRCVPGVTVTATAKGSDLCAMDATVSDLQTGVPYELVFFVDAPHRYRTLNVGLHQVFGVSHGWGTFVSDTSPLCPASSPNAGQRPHVVRLRVLAPGAYRLEAVIVDDPLKDGMVIDRLSFTVK